MRPRAWLLAAALALHGEAWCGSVTGHTLVWVNLSHANAQAVDSAVKALFDGPDDDCWGADTLVYMRKRPPGITPGKVRAALLRREPQAQRALRAVLRRPFDEVSSFDGLVAYVDTPEPRLISLSVGGKLRSDTVRGSTGELVWDAAFCNVMPPISRKP